MTKVVQMFTANDHYVSSLQHELNKSDSFNKAFENDTICMRDVINSFEKQSGISFESSGNAFLKAIYCYKLNKYMIDKFAYLKGSVVDIQYVSIYYPFLMPFLKKTFKKIVLSFWGSDLMRQSRFKLRFIKQLANTADVITVQTNDFSRLLIDKLGRKQKQKIRVVNFGNSFLDIIDSTERDNISKFKERHHIIPGRKVVSIGYNASKEQQHIEVIESIIRAGVKKEDIFIVVPWTYPYSDDKYKKRISELLDNKYEYAFLDKRLSDMEVGALRLITDILIQVQLTDCMSASMLETLYAGNEVITGEWLPYDDLYQLGLKMSKVNSVQDVGTALCEMLKSSIKADEREINKNKVRELTDWRNVIDDWIELYV